MILFKCLAFIIFSFLMGLKPSGAMEGLSSQETKEEFSKVYFLRNQIISTKGFARIHLDESSAEFYIAFKGEKPAFVGIVPSRDFRNQHPSTLFLPLSGEDLSNEEISGAIKRFFENQEIPQYFKFPKEMELCGSVLAEKFFIEEPILPRNQKKRLYFDIVSREYKITQDLLGDGSEELSGESLVDVSWTRLCECPSETSVTKEKRGCTYVQEKILDFLSWVHEKEPEFKFSEEVIRCMDDRNFLNRLIEEEYSRREDGKKFSTFNSPVKNPEESFLEKFKEEENHLKATLRDLDESTERDRKNTEEIKSNLSRGSSFGYLWGTPLLGGGVSATLFHFTGGKKVEEWVIKRFLGAEDREEEEETPHSHLSAKAKIAGQWARGVSDGIVFLITTWVTHQLLKSLSR